VFGNAIKDLDHSTGGALAPAATRVYAIGDIHGRLDLLEELHRRIRRDAAEAAAARKVVVYVGDYVDRGPESAGVLDSLIEQPLRGFDCVHLLGNHEAFMLEFLEQPSKLGVWLMNGGDATFQSFGIDPFDNYDAADRAACLRDALKARLEGPRLDFLRALKLSHVEGDYLFVHAGIRPGRALEDQDAADLLWIREPFLDSEVDFGKVVVHGHTPGGEPVLRANRIGIDTGAVYGGVLTAVVLEGASQRFLYA